MKPLPATTPSAVPRVHRIRTPTVLQMEMVECGAASLGIVLGYFGRFVPLEELRVACGVSREGSSLARIQAAAERYGLKARGFRRDLGELYSLSLPAILRWNRNHFVVLEGFAKERAWINDPEGGPRSVSLEELRRAFSSEAKGAVLIFQPMPDFRPGGEPSRPWRALFRRLRATRGSLAYLVLCALCLVVPGLAIPAFSRLFIDEILLNSQADVLRYLLLGMAATALARGLLTYLQRTVLLRLERALAVVGTSSFLEIVLRLPYSFFGQRLTGEIVDRVALSAKVAQTATGKLASSALDSLLVLFFLAAMLANQLTLGLLVAAATAIQLLFAERARRSREDAARRVSQEFGRLRGTAANGLRLIETYKASGAEGDFFARWAADHARALSAEQRLARVALMVEAVPVALSSVTTALVLIVGGYEVLAGRMTLGMLVAYQSLTASFVRPLGNLVASFSSLQELAADITRIEDVERNGDDAVFQPPTEETKVTGRLAGKIELTDLSFSYSPSSAPVLQQINLLIQPGQRVALVGSSGSGKSTLARLIAGLYQPTSGSILLDGIPREQISREVLSQAISLVDQNVMLFGGTVRENLALWNPDVPERNLVDACADAQIAREIERRPSRYDTEVLEGGGNFSGGQRQRLEIARALAARPSVLILDEATSALDPETELKVDQALRRRGLTSLIVAHRLSTIRDSDEILVLDQGRIVERGPHDDLVALGGLYSRLVQE